VLEEFSFVLWVEEVATSESDGKGEPFGSFGFEGGESPEDCVVVGCDEHWGGSGALAGFG